MNKQQLSNIMESVTLFELDSYYLDLYNELMNIPEVYTIPMSIKRSNMYRVPKKRKTNVREAIHLFRNYGIDLHHVPVLKDFDISDREWPENDMNLVKQMNPRFIPVYSYDSLKVDGLYNPLFSDLTITDIKEKKNDKTTKVFSGIRLEVDSYPLTFSSYNNQITHTQLDSVEGSVKDYLNSEVLPIFFELLTAASMTPHYYYTVKNLRLNDLANRIKDIIIYRSNSLENILYDYKYIVSILKALNLLDTYTIYDDETKKDILAYIQSIFDGDLTLETLLDAYNITLDDSKKDIKALKKI